MGKVINLSIDLSEALEDHLAANVGDARPFDDAGQFFRDLLQRDLERADEERRELLRQELKRAFAAPESSFHSSSPEDVFARNAAS